MWGIVEPVVLVQTKLFVPRSRGRHLARPRLSQRLASAEDGGLVLVSAPAGFGKSTLIAEWARSGAAPVAWLSLDANDDQPARFWSYFLAALARVAPALEPLAARARDDDAPPAQVLVTELVNLLAVADTAVWIVLDDLHVIEDRDIHDALVFLLEHRPPQLGLVVTTRADPPWPLPRMRARRELTEIRAQDLRFDGTETREFLVDVSGLELTAGDVDAMATRTEGWIAGLHMAALSMAGRDDVADFVRDFSGSHRFILDYLADEVLAQQPEDLRQFLLRTAILDRMCGPLCDAVTGLDGSHAVLEGLEQRNLFVVVLDDERTWFRYHHLFGDYLRARLRSQRAGELPELHRRASVWLEQHGEVDDAIDHALAGDDPERAADLIETVATDEFAVQHQVNTLAWLARLPNQLLAARPALASARAFAAFVTGRWHEAQSVIDAVREVAPANLVPKLRVIQSFLSFELGRLEQGVAQARALLDDLANAPAEPQSLAQLAAASSLAHLDDQDATLAACERVLELSRAGDMPINVQVALSLQAQVAAWRGDLNQLERCHRQAMALAGDDETPVLLAAAITRVTYAEALRERDQLDDAETTLDVALDHCRRQLGLPEHVIRGSYVLARTLRHRDQPERAERCEDAAEQLLAENLADRPEVSRILWPALIERARLWIESGRAQRADAWLAANDALALTPARRRVRDLLRARVALGRGDLDAAAGSLVNTGDAPASHPGAIVEHQLLAAALAHGRGDVASAAGLLASARATAAPHGYRRIFVDAVGLVPGFDPTSDAPAAAVATQPAPARPIAAEPAAPVAELLEPLNDRESSLLRYLDAGLTNAEIASELYLSVHTIKWHVRNLFSKLDVRNRTSALARARELGLL